MRVVLDANVAIAAAATRGLCEAVQEACLARHHLILCEGILNEIKEKLGVKIKVPASVIADYIRLLRHNAQVLEPEEVDSQICRDPKDLMVLGLAPAGRADAIVTGDKDLLIIGKYRQAQIMTPRSFWELTKNEREIM